MNEVFKFLVLQNDFIFPQGKKKSFFLGGVIEELKKLDSYGKANKDEKAVSLVAQVTRKLLLNK